MFNLRDSIEEARMRAEQATDERTRKQHAHRGLQNLRRYFELIIFQAYLQSAEPDTMQTHESLESFVKSRPVIKTFEKELITEDLNTLKPLERVDVGDGAPLPEDVVKNALGITYLGEEYGAIALPAFDVSTQAGADTVRHMPALDQC